MSVSLGYFSVKPVARAAHDQLLAMAAEANRAYQWWGEPISLSPVPNATGHILGASNLFRDIDDEDTDTYMAFLDGDEIIKFLTLAANRLGIEWRLEFEGMPIGGVTADGPDAELQTHTKMFLEMYPANFDELKTRKREDILARWKNINGK